VIKRAQHVYGADNVIHQGSDRIDAVCLAVHIRFDSCSAKKMTHRVRKATLKATGVP